MSEVSGGSPTWNWASPEEFHGFPSPSESLNPGEEDH